MSDRTPRPGASGPLPARPPRPRADDGWYVRSLRRRVLGAIVCVLLALLIGRVALATAWGQAVDTLFMEAAVQWDDRFGAFSQTITSTIGSVPAIVLVGVLVAAFAVFRKRPTLAGRALVVILGANATTQVVKALIERPDLGVTTPIANSLPSGHTTVAMSFALALIMVAPRYLRGPVAWAGWAWTSLMGFSVMVAAWHRLADVLVAVLVAGAWALALAPIEGRERHVPQARRVLAVGAGALALVALLLSVIALLGVEVTAVATPGSSGYGFSEFLADSPWRARLLFVAGPAWVAAVCGAVVHEVDALCVNRP